MTFTKTELNYAALDSELAALRYGVKTFRPFLYGIEFILYIDHEPLVYLHSMKMVSSKLSGIVEEL